MNSRSRGFASATVIPCRSISACTLKLPRASLRMVRLPTVGRRKRRLSPPFVQSSHLIRSGEAGFRYRLAYGFLGPFGRTQRFRVGKGAAEQICLVVSHGILS
jgi:hypothetical protein